MAGPLAARAAGAAVLTAAVVALLTATAQARTVCGQEPAVGVVYRVAAVHLTLTITGHFQDDVGDYENATFTTDEISHPPFNYQNFGDFGGCRGDPSTCIAHAPICRGVWWSSTAVETSTAVTESEYDSGMQDGSPPSTSSCQGSYRSGREITSAWRTPLNTGAGVAGTPRRPKLAVGDYSTPLQFGTCDVDNVEVLDDIVTDVLYHTYFAPTTLSLNVLWRAGRQLTMPVNVTYSGPIPVVGYEQYEDDGASTTASVHWQGSIRFVRAYTCKPNGCAPPAELPPAGDSSG